MDMRANYWKAMVAAGVGSLVAVGAARAQAPAPAAAAAEPAPAAGRAGHENLADKDAPGPIDNIQDLEDTGKMMFKAADTNNDGQISQKEAIDAGNLLVGGFFFRADANGDGTLTQDEARQAREALLQQKPLLRFVVQRAKAARPAGAGASPNPGQGLLNLVDTNNDKQIQATEVRQAVQTGVQGVFASADTNRDGQLSPSEINAAMIGAVNTAARAAFQAADADNNGSLSKDEFNKALAAPTATLFVVLDANNDGQISPQELQTAERILASQLRHLRVPEPANSLGNMIGSGRAAQPGAVPTFRTPREAGVAPANPNQPPR